MHDNSFTASFEPHECGDAGQAWHGITLVLHSSYTERLVLECM